MSNLDKNKSKKRKRGHIEDSEDNSDDSDEESIDDFGRRKKIGHYVLELSQSVRQGGSQNPLRKSEKAQNKRKDWKMDKRVLERQKI